MTVDIQRRPPPGHTRAAIASVTLDDLTTSTGAAMGSGELTPTEVAREFNVSPATVRRWEAAGILAPTRRLPGSKHRRYSREAVDALKQKLNESDDTSPS